MKINNLFIVFMMLLLSCESGLNEISFDEATGCIISSECIYSHQLHRIGRIYIDVYYTDSVYDSYLIKETEENGGKGYIYIKTIPDEYTVMHWHDKRYTACPDHNFVIHPNCRYKIEHTTYGHVPACILYLFTDSLNQLHEDTNPFSNEID